MGTKLATAGFSIPFSFEEDFPHEWNSLLVDDSTGALYLVDYCPSDKIYLNDLIIPIDRIEEQVIARYRVPLLEALEWYVRCDAWSSGATGNVAILCELAAQALREAQTAKALPGG